MTDLPHREQTDESLRIERERADQAVAEEQAAIDEVADAVISRARARADAVLAAARQRADQETGGPTPFGASSGRARVREDALLEEERAKADEVLRQERQHHPSQLSKEREETDKDLSLERVLSDDLQVTLDGLLDVVSHELRHRLNTMVGLAASIATRVSQDNDQVRADAQRLQRSGAATNRLLDDLTDVVSLDAGTFFVTHEFGDPAAVVTEAVEAFQAQAAARAISLVAEIEQSGTSAAFDPARILQVLTHLLSKAIKRTPAHGSVRVRVDRTAELIRVAVSDTGPDVSREELGTRFERLWPFGADTPRGEALRLYVCKCIIREHGGRMWAEANAAGGMTFYFILPSSVTSP